MKTENGGDNNGAGRNPLWWVVVPTAEKAVICDLVAAMRGVKGSRTGPNAQAARKWERRIVCYIKFRLMAEKAPRRWQRHETTVETRKR